MGFDAFVEAVAANIETSPLDRYEVGESGGEWVLTLYFANGAVAWHTLPL